MPPLAADAGYVAAAYLVFVALVVAYAVILAVRIRRARRALRELDEPAGERPVPQRAGDREPVGAGHE